MTNTNITDVDRKRCCDDWRHECCGPIQRPSDDDCSIVYAEIIDNNDAPGRVLDGALPFNVRVRWELGSLADVIGASSRFRIEVFADQLGGPIDKSIGGPLYVTAVPGQRSYPVVDVLCAALVDNPPIGESSLFRLAATLTFENNGVNTVVGGFVELPLIRTL